MPSTGALIIDMLRCSHMHRLYLSSLHPTIMSDQSSKQECRDVPEAAVYHPLPEPMAEGLGETREGELPTDVMAWERTDMSFRQSKLFATRYCFHASLEVG